ncbi:MAG: GNAT family N-acetyltransferase [Porphyromonas sp.]|nr:GNAT family N-acetyltransferase [Porphyromonas sp.]
MTDSDFFIPYLYRIPQDTVWIGHSHCREMLGLMVEAFGPYELLFSRFVESVAIPLRTSFLAMDRESDRVVAALQAVPYIYSTPADAPPVAYLYALVTDSDYRAQGVMSRLIDFALDAWRKEWGRGEAILIPATEELIPYYSKRGFRLLGTAWQQSADLFAFDPQTLSPHPLVLEYQAWEEQQQLSDGDSEEHAPLSYPMFLPDPHTDSSCTPLLQNPLL